MCRNTYVFRLVVLGLRTRDELLALFDAAGLRVAGRMDVRSHHPKGLGCR